MKQAIETLKEAYKTRMEQIARQGKFIKRFQKDIEDSEATIAVLYKDIDEINEALNKLEEN